MRSPGHWARRYDTATPSVDPKEVPGLSITIPGGYSAEGLETRQVGSHAAACWQGSLRLCMPRLQTATYSACCCTGVCAQQGRHCQDPHVHRGQEERHPGRKQPNVPLRVWRCRPSSGYHNSIFAIPLQDHGDGKSSHVHLHAGFGITTEPTFSVSRLAFMLAYGGVYAIAGIRCALLSAPPSTPFLRCRPSPTEAA